MTIAPRQDVVNKKTHVIENMLTGLVGCATVWDMVTEGASKLDRWLAQHDRSAAWLARQAGCSASMIGAIRRSEALPSVKIAAGIERATDGAVPILAWDRAEPVAS